MRIPLVFPALLMSLLIGAPACSKSSSSHSGTRLSPAKQQDLRNAIASIQQGPADMRGMLAATALAEVESERLPQPIIETLAALTNVSPATRAQLVSEGLTQSMDALEILCQGAGLKTMKQLGDQPEENRVALIRKECNTDRLKIVSNPGPNSDVIQYLLAHLVLSHLQKNGIVSADEKILIEIFATAPPPADSN